MCVHEQIFMVFLCNFWQRGVKFLKVIVKKKNQKQTKLHRTKIVILVWIPATFFSLFILLVFLIRWGTFVSALTFLRLMTLMTFYSTWHCFFVAVHFSLQLSSEWPVCPNTKKAHLASPAPLHNKSYVHEIKEKPIIDSFFFPSPHVCGQGHCELCVDNRCYCCTAFPMDAG